MQAVRVGPESTVVREKKKTPHYTKFGSVGEEAV